MIVSNRYETAFDAYLRFHRHMRLAVDEKHRSMGLDGPLKSPDFVVVTPNGRQFIIDVKGRKFPGGTEDKPRLVWQNWVTEGDIESLAEWQQMMGPRSEGIFVFAYQLRPEIALPLGTLDLWHYKRERFLFRAVRLADYRPVMRVRSPKWRTVGLLHRDFRSIVRPFVSLLD